MPRQPVGCLQVLVQGLFPRAATTSLASDRWKQAGLTPPLTQLPHCYQDKRTQSRPPSHCHPYPACRMCSSTISRAGAWQSYPHPPTKRLRPPLVSTTQSEPRRGSIAAIHLPCFPSSTIRWWSSGDGRGWTFQPWCLPHLQRHHPQGQHQHRCHPGQS